MVELKDTQPFSYTKANSKATLKIDLVNFISILLNEAPILSSLFGISTVDQYG